MNPIERKNVMNLNASLFAQLVVFFILVWFTARFIWPPLKKALDDRAARVAAALEASEHGKMAMVTSEERAQAIVATSQEDARKLLADYDRRAQTIIEEARRVAAVEAERIITTAHMEANQLLDRSRTQLREDIAAIAVGGAEQILKREIDATVHARLLTQLKDEI